MRRLRRGLVVGLAAVAAALGAASIAARPAAAQSATGTGTGSADADVDLLSRAGDARVSGPDTARVILIEFFDFACPTCQQFHVQRADSLRRALPADVRFITMHYLIPNLLRSYHAAEAALCAAVIGGRDAYHGMSDLLFRRAADWRDVADPGEVFARYARDIGVDAAAFSACRARDLPAPLIVIDITTAQKFGVGGTPTFVAIPRGAQGPDDAFQAHGNVSIAELTALIDKARAKAK